MTNREFYQETFSQVHSSVPIRWEDFEQRQKPRRKKPVRRLWLLAAVVALAAALSAVAVAAHLLGLRDLVLPDQQQVQVTDENGDAVPGQTQATDTLSLSGYLDTPESQGLAEWNDFLSSYDPDGAILKVVGNYTDPALDKYRCYMVYTQEMADRLEEIAAKYHLTLHTWNHVVEDQAEWISLLGDFLGTNTAYSGRIYEDGTFNYDGYLDTGSGARLDYQFRRSVKGGLNDVYLTVDDLSAYEEWYYKTDEGREITLDLGPGRGFLLADLGDSFISVTVLEGTDQEVTKQDMKDLADSFDFSLLTPARPLDESLRETPAQESGQSGSDLPGSIAGVLAAEGVFYDAPHNGTTTLLQYLDSHAPAHNRLAADSFAAIDLDGDGRSEAVVLLTLDTGADYGCLVLRQGEDGTVYGYTLASGELTDLKVDGTYSYCYDTSSGFGRMIFSDTDISGTIHHDWATAPKGSADTTTGGDGTVSTDWYLDYQSVTRADYEAALAIQQGKEDVSWHFLYEIQAP